MKNVKELFFLRIQQIYNSFTIMFHVYVNKAIGDSFLK